MIILLNAMYKGGVGKTTNNVILSHQLAERGYKVLFLDFDSQMSGTRFLSQRSIYDKEFEEKNIFEATLKDDLESNIIQVKSNLDFVAGNEFINLFELIMSKKGIEQQKYLYFRSLLKGVHEKGKYDFVVLDMSPSKSALNTAIMAAATHHIITTQPEILSMEMIEKYKSDIEELQEEHKIESELLGIAINMRDRTKLSHQVSKTIEEYYENLVFSTKTKRLSKIHEYVVVGHPKRNRRGVFNVKDSAALYFHSKLTDEILQRLNLSKIKAVN